MDARRILIIDGHPDPDPARFCHALSNAYAEGAAGHMVRRLDLATLDFPLLRKPSDWMTGEPPAAIAAAQADIAWADHLVLVYPLWLGDMPALLKAFLEQVMRPGFALEYRARGLPRKLLRGRSARVIVSMGMPAAFYRLVYRAHSAKSLERNVLRFVGIRPVAWTMIGSVASDTRRRERWLGRLGVLGAAGR